jgi:hypothetical protein
MYSLLSWAALADRSVADRLFDGALVGWWACVGDASQGFEKLVTDALPLFKSLSIGAKAEKQNHQHDTQLPAEEVMLLVCASNCTWIGNLRVLWAAWIQWQ